jgi:phosphoglycolate phosphatase
MKLFFDLDGPILDVSDRYFRVYCECFNGTSHVPLLKDYYWDKKKQKISEAEILSSDLNMDLVSTCIKDRKKLIENPAFLKYDKVWADLVPIYEHLFHKIPTVLVTLRSNPENLHQQLKNLNIDSWFYRILSHPNIDQPEDRWKIKVNLIQESGLLDNISPEECLFIGDTETDILAGKKLKMETAAVSFGIRTSDILLKYKPDQIFHTQLQLSMFLQKRYLCQKNGLIF